MPQSDAPKASQVGNTNLNADDAVSQDSQITPLNDWDLGNVLYTQDIPAVPANKQAELDACIENINSYLVFELARVEEQVQSKLKDGALPDDDSVASKSKRISYRFKVITAYRLKSPWLSSMGSLKNTATVSATEDKINEIIMNNIVGIASSNLSKSPNVVDLVKHKGDVHFIKARQIDQTVQPHVFSLIEYRYDEVSQSIVVSIKMFHFQVTLKETQDPAPPKSRGGRLLSKLSSTLRGDEEETPDEDIPHAVAPPRGKYYEATIEYSSSTVAFNFGQWNPEAVIKAVSPELLDVGKKIFEGNRNRLLPVKSGPVKSGPVKSGPVKSGPVKSETVKSE
ncbi:hypothetical protein V8F33_003552 [Rhypophila sp. PSN 637]